MKETIHIQFDKPLRHWDGFGFNYVEVSQTRNYEKSPQEYGGFSLLTESDRQTILDMVFGDDGLKPGLVKMFLDVFHQPEPEAENSKNSYRIQPKAYDHKTTTHWICYCAQEGLRRTRMRGDDMQIVVTLYGPPAWMTKQKIVRGRDLNPAHKVACAKYMAAFAHYLREEEGLPVRYISLHNEGEDWVRWPADGTDDSEHDMHDYNLYWSPEMVAEFIKLLPPILEANGMADVGIACGETTNWQRFYEWGYADAIADDDEAMANLGLISSHGFYAPRWTRWHADWRSVGIDVLREKRPSLHAWVTSTSWSKMDVEFVNEIRNNIYGAKVNGLIPWAGIQRRGKWVGGDPNPGTAFEVFEDGTWNIMPGYYFYKQVCRAGQPGMAVARVRSNETMVNAIAFASNGTKHPDAFVILNLEETPKSVAIHVSGSSNKSFAAYRTSPEENYVSIDDCSMQEGIIQHIAHPRSVTTFFAR